MDPPSCHGRCLLRLLPCQRSVCSPVLPGAFDSGRHWGPWPSPQRTCHGSNPRPVNGRASPPDQRLKRACSVAVEVAETLKMIPATEAVATSGTCIAPSTGCSGWATISPWTANALLSSSASEPQNRPGVPPPPGSRGLHPSQTPKKSPKRLRKVTMWRNQVQRDEPVGFMLFSLIGRSGPTCRQCALVHCGRGECDRG